MSNNFERVSVEAYVCIIYMCMSVHKAPNKKIDLTETLINVIERKSFDFRHI